MKALYLKTLWAAALTVTFSACQKDAENLMAHAEKKIASVSKVVYPLDGNEMSTSILPKKDNLPDAILERFQIDEFAKFKVISQICDEYISGTRKLDISKVEEGVFGKKIVNEDFTVFFSQQFATMGDGFVKLNHEPKGWWTHWNYSPYTESEYPQVMLAVDEYGRYLNDFVLSFDKDVTMFGFEVSPNTTSKDMTVSISYHQINDYRNPALAFVKQTVSSPSGARLIAVKSETPIRMVQIGLQSDDVGGGVAIANIRYALAK